MAQKILIQDGNISYAATDPAYSVNMGVEGHLNVTKQLNVGDDPLAPGIITTPPGSGVDLILRTDTDGITYGNIKLEATTGGDIILNNTIWPTNTISVGKFIGASGPEQLTFYDFIIAYNPSDTLTPVDLNNAYPGATPGQSVFGPTVLYYCVGTGGWRTLLGTGSGSGGVSAVSVTTANGVSGSVLNPTTTPAITLTLGAITPTSVAATGPVTGSNFSGSVSGTNTGDQTISLTGDMTGSGTGSFAATLSTTGVSSGTYGSATQVPVFTVDSKGRITGVTNTTIAGGGGSGTVTSVSVTTANGVSGTVATATTTPTITLTLGAITPTSVAATGTVTGTNLSGTNTGNQAIVLSGDATNANTSTGGVLTLANTPVVAGSYTAANITVDSKGRLTSATNGSATISIPNTQVVYGTGASVTSDPDFTFNSATDTLVVGSTGSALVKSFTGQSLQLASNNGAYGITIGILGDLAINGSTGSSGQVLISQGSGSPAVWAETVGSTAPPLATSAGRPGEVRYDSSFIYVCIAGNTWRRAAISAW